MAVLDLGEIGDGVALLVQYKDSSDDRSYRVVTRRSGTLEASDPLGPTSMAAHGTMRVDGDEIIVALSEKPPGKPRTSWVAVLSSETLRPVWRRRFSRPGHWQPLLEVGPEHVYTWARGPIALDRETGETVWSRPGAAKDSARDLRLIGEVLQVGLIGSFQLIDDRGETIASVQSRARGCLEPNRTVGLGRTADGSKRLLETNLTTGVVEPVGPAEPGLDGLDSWRCLRFGDRRLFLGSIQTENHAPGAVMTGPDGRVQWRAKGPGNFGLARSLESLDALPVKTRHIPIATLTADAHRLAVLDLREKRWTLTEQDVPGRHAVIAFERCWVVAGRTRAIAVDAQTGRIRATRDYMMSLWKKSGRYLWVVDEHAKRTTRFHGCTLAPMPF